MRHYSSGFKMKSFYSSLSQQQEQDNKNENTPKDPRQNNLNMTDDDTSRPFIFENIEKNFLRRHNEFLEQTGSLKYKRRVTILPCTQMIREQKPELSKVEKTIKFLEDACLNPPRIFPGGDSEISTLLIGKCETTSNSTYTTTTEDDILAGESATDWQNIKFRECQSSHHSIPSVAYPEDVDMDTDFIPFKHTDSEDTKEKDEKTKSIFPDFSTWTLDEITNTVTNVFLTTLAIALMYKFIQRRL